jgi:hypothetical protein
MLKGLEEGVNFSQPWRPSPTPWRSKRGGGGSGPSTTLNAPRLRCRRPPPRKHGRRQPLPRCPGRRCRHLAGAYNTSCACTPPPTKRLGRGRRYKAVALTKRHHHPTGLLLRTPRQSDAQRRQAVPKVTYCLLSITPSLASSCYRCCCFTY